MDSTWTCCKKRTVPRYSVHQSKIAKRTAFENFRRVLTSQPKALGAGFYAMIIAFSSCKCHKTGSSRRVIVIQSYACRLGSALSIGGIVLPHNRLYQAYFRAWSATLFTLPTTFFVPYTNNPTNVPQLRPIENAHTLIKRQVFSEGFDQKNEDELKLRIIEIFNQKNDFCVQLQLVSVSVFVDCAIIHDVMDYCQHAIDERYVHLSGTFYFIKKYCLVAEICPFMFGRELMWHTLLVA